MTTIFSKHPHAYIMYMSTKTYVLKIDLSLSYYLPEDFHILWPKRLRAESTHPKNWPKRPTPKIGRNDPGRNDSGRNDPGFTVGFTVVYVYLFFLFFIQNIYSGYYLEPPRQGESDVHQ